MNDTKGLSELLHSTKVSIIAITIHTHWHVKFNIAIGVIRLALPYIPWHTRSAKHYACKGIV
jgi:hypothetical protein